MEDYCCCNPTGNPGQVQNSTILKSNDKIKIMKPINSGSQWALNQKKSISSSLEFDFRLEDWVELGRERDKNRPILKEK